VRSIALFVGLLILALGAIGGVAPGVLLTFGQRLLTPVGLYMAGALRVLIGLVLLGASSASRMPRTLRVCGILAVAAGVVTPILGVERAHAIMTWSMAQGSVVVRLWAMLAAALGGVIIYAVGGRRTT
jgi:uncharacterized membrane protein